MKIEELTEDHFQRLEEIGFWLDDPPADFKQKVLEQARRGNAYAVIKEDEVIVIGGIASYWEGVGEAWAIYSKNLNRNLKDCFRESRSILNYIIENSRFHRVQAVSRCVGKNCRWLEKMGFRFEVKLNKYNPDKTDAFMYAIVR